MQKPRKPKLSPETPIAYKDRVVFDPDYIRHDYASLARAFGRFLGFGRVRSMPGLVTVDFGESGQFHVPFHAIRSAEPYLASSQRT